MCALLPSPLHFTGHQTERASTPEQEVTSDTDTDADIDTDTDADPSQLLVITPELLVTLFDNPSFYQNGGLSRVQLSH